jgi:adenine-specific DNA-methyltransferase
MRYIGNKTRLLSFITDALRQLAIPPGIAHDAFAGTASVGRELRRLGWRVASSDLMTYSYVFQRAYVVAPQRLSFAALRAGDPDVRRALRSPTLRAHTTAHPASTLHLIGAYLTYTLEPECDFISEHFAPAGGRMYFTDTNAQRIDAVRHALHRWRRDGLIDDNAYYVLLAALLEGADRAANTAGVYAAYIKQWQRNARRHLTVEPAPPLPGARGSSAHLGDAAAVARTLGPVDLLYIDPPYNSRQYRGYYHVPEIIARGWFDARPTLRGKTGLLDDPSQRSAWCSAGHVQHALRELLAASGARHVLVSYNSEGLLPAVDLQTTLREAAADGKVRPFARSYRRYRADSDHPGRQYRGDTVRELLYYIRLR